jgi:uncharacterized protein YbbC (DUF1343 family)
LENQYQKLFKEYKTLISKKRVGLFCNQVSFDFSSGKYLLQLLSKKAGHLTVFTPEHGLFAEQQDQVIIENTRHYEFLDPTVSIVSFYRKVENRIGNIKFQLKELDTLIIDIQDIGCRYYTYITTIGEIFNVIIENELPLSVVIIDKPNPAGRQVEGTRLKPEFSSLIGLTGLPHRYGLTIGELCWFLRSKFGGQFQLEIIQIDSNELSINPSPNIPDKKTCLIYSGQCLLEGTNFSEGRGTTRPFEIFGAPYLKNLSQDWVDLWNSENREAVLRPLIFIPSFHKYKNEICYGFQLHPMKEMHSLMYSLKMLRSLSFNSAQFEWLAGPYEAGSARPAIELLAGDTDMLQYLYEGSDEREMVDKIKIEEKEWIEVTQSFLIYNQPLYSRFN